MSYSDYGSYNWKKEKGNWVFKPEFEDTNLFSQITGDPISKKTVNFLGMDLKLGAVKDSMDLEEKYPEIPFEILHTHHSVIGDLKGFAVVSFKGNPTVLWKGKIIDKITYEDVDDEYYDDRTKKYKKIKNFIPKVIKIIQENCMVKVLIDTSFNYWSIAYIKNNDDEYIGMCGYGLGDHWWLDDNGDHTEDEDEVGENEIPKKEHWPREKECLEISLKALFYEI